MITEKKFFKLVVLVGLFFIFSLIFYPISSKAQIKEEYPSKPITVINCMGPGGSLDITLRVLASVIHSYIGQPFVVVSKSGGGGSVAGNFLAKSKPDGYTVSSLISRGYFPEMYEHFGEVPYTSADIKPVCRIGVTPYALSVRADSAWKTLEDFINYAKRNPGKVTYGHSGRGHHYDLLMAALAKRTGIEIKDVPFKGGGPTNAALLGGHIDLSISATEGQQPFVEAGKFRMLVIQHPKRLDLFKDVPTFIELGYDLSIPPHFSCLFVPKGTPDNFIKKLADSIKNAFDDSSFKAIAAKTLSNLDFGDTEAVKQDLELEKKLMPALLKKLGFWKE